MTGPGAKRQSPAPVVEVEMTVQGVFRARDRHGWRCGQPVDHVPRQPTFTNSSRGKKPRVTGKNFWGEYEWFSIGTQLREKVLVE